MSATMIVILIVGSLLVSGQKSWARTFNYANSKAQLDAIATTITFGAIGRKSNRLDYKLFEINGNTFSTVLPEDDPEEVVVGQAVEFHYWDTGLNDDILDTSITGTAYALFYLEGDTLMLDLGPYPPGGIDEDGSRFEGSSVKTLVLAQNVTALEFSHTTRNLQGDGKGCVRLNLTVADPNDNKLTTVTAATLLRNVWP